MATDFCPDSNSRLQRRQYRLSKTAPDDRERSGKKILLRLAAGSKCVKRFLGVKRPRTSNNLRIKVCSRQKDSLRALLVCGHRKVALDPNTSGGGPRLKPGSASASNRTITRA